MADHDEREGDGIHPVDPVVEDSDADDDAPEVAGQERDVLEGGTGEAVEDGDQGVEEGEDQGIPGQVAGDFAVPGGVAECLAVKDAGLDTIDDGSPEAQLANDLVQWPSGDEPLLVDIAQSVAGGPEQGEEVSLQLIATADVPAVGPGQMVGP